MTKNELRKILKEIRDKIPLEKRIEKSKKVAEKLFSMPFFNEGISDKHIMSFLNISSEIETSFIHKKIWDLSGNLYLPKVVSIKKREMSILVYKPDTILKKSNYGILEPIGGISISPEELDIIIVPALAFDKNGFRLGYGGGFYDQLLSSSRTDCKKIGIAFSEQLINDLPHEEHDEKIDIIIHA